MAAKAMSAGKWTPGPWGISRICSTLVTTTSDRGVATTGGYSNNAIDPDKLLAENEANARLIAAAPDMVEALEAMLEWDAREKDHAVDFHARMDMCWEAFAKARAALQKATGEQP